MLRLSVVLLLISYLLIAEAAIGDCVFKWLKGKKCSKKCDGGVVTSTYKIIKPATTGKPCEYKTGDTKTVSCNTKPCASGNSKCVFKWTKVGKCSKKCDGGSITSTYTVIKPAKGTGTPCQFENGATKTDSCNTQPCVVESADCVFKWTKVGKCSKKCDGGVITSTYTVIKPAKGTGAPCLENGATKTDSCNVQPCDASESEPPKSSESEPPKGSESEHESEPPKGSESENESPDCVGKFDKVQGAKCSKKCDGGSITAVYRIIKPAAAGGAECPNKAGDTITQACNIQPCDIGTESEGPNGSEDGPEQPPPPRP